MKSPSCNNSPALADGAPASFSLTLRSLHCWSGRLSAPSLHSHGGAQSAYLSSVSSTIPSAPGRRRCPRRRWHAGGRWPAGKGCVAAADSSAGVITSYSIHYTKLYEVNLTLGYEVLGSDDGKKGFATPLATGHKFQGFADKFLTTPNDGVQDLYVGVARITSYNVCYTKLLRKFESPGPACRRRSRQSPAPRRSSAWPPS